MISPPNNRPLLPFASLYTAVILVLLAAAFVILCVSSGFRPEDILRIIADTSFTAHQNIMFYITINRTPLPAYIFIGVFSATFGAAIFTRIFGGRAPQYFADLSPLGHFRHVVAVVLVVLNIFQIISIQRHWQESASIFNTGNRYEATSYARPKRIAEAFRQAVKDRPLSAEFVTDMDISHDPGMLEHRSLAFFLYPVDIRNIYDANRDAWIAYQKKNAAETVPEGYQIIYQYDERNLIAVKLP